MVAGARGAQSRPRAGPTAPLARAIPGAASRRSHPCASSSPCCSPPPAAPSIAPLRADPQDDLDYRTLPAAVTALVDSPTPSDELIAAFAAEPDPLPNDNQAARRELDRLASRGLY